MMFIDTMYNSVIRVVYKYNVSVSLHLSCWDFVGVLHQLHVLCTGAHLE